MYLNHSELYDALGLVMEKIEMAGASPELTSAVVLVGDIRAAIGNRWNPASPEAADRVRRLMKADALLEERDAAEAAADKLASLVLKEAINWTDHRAKWLEAIEQLDRRNGQDEAIRSGS